MKKLLLLLVIALLISVGMLYLGVMPQRFHDFVDTHAPGPVRRMVYSISQIRGEPAPSEEPDTPLAPPRREPQMPLIDFDSIPAEVSARELSPITRQVIEGVLALEDEIAIEVVLPQGSDDEISAYFLGHVEAAVDIVRREVPQVFWLSLGPFSIEWSGIAQTGEGTLRVFLNYRHSREEAARMIAQMQRVVDDISASAPEDTLEKITFFHDWIINNTVYARYLIDLDIPVQRYEHGFNIDGVFLRGSAVCEGYSKAFKLLLDRAGIPNVIVYGRAKDENHSWNYVQLNGQWYLVDVTWNDPVGEEDMLLHTFFLLGSESLVDGVPVSEIFTPDGADYPTLSRTGFFE